MDSPRFDLLTRTFASAASRRITLSGLAGGVIASLDLKLPGTTLSKKKGGKKKRKGKKNKQKCNDGNPIRCGKKCCRADQTCRDGQCLQHCADGIKNFGETDIDCGGSCVQPGSTVGTCGFGQGCSVDGDCFTNVCVSKGAGKQCAVCRIDSDCDRIPNIGPRCLDNQCFPCAADFDCSPEAPFCIGVAGCPNGLPCICGTCRVDTDCPEGQLCEDGRCIGFACESNQDCPTGRACENGACTGICVPPGGDITDEGECCADVACVVGDADICCDFGQTCIGSGAEERCG